MNSFKVEGGVKLNGDVFPQGAKNEALQVICAVILTEKEVQLLELFLNNNKPLSKE